MTEAEILNEVNRSINLMKHIDKELTETMSHLDSKIIELNNNLNKVIKNQSLIIQRMFHHDCALKMIKDYFKEHDLLTDAEMKAEIEKIIQEAERGGISGSDKAGS